MLEIQSLALGLLLIVSSAIAYKGLQIGGCISFIIFVIGLSTVIAVLHKNGIDI